MSVPVTPAPLIRPGDSAYRYATLAIGLLLAGALGYLGALEIAARVFYPVHSELATRIRSDWNTALQLSVTPPPHRRNFLVVGNSLLQAAIDRKELRALPRGDTLSVAILPIENTDYFDWYFGVRRLLAEGSKPEFVVLCLAPAQLISNSTDGVQFARTLMRPVDILQVKQAAGLDWTTTTTYMMASVSAWIGDSAGIRNWIRSETVPGMAGLAPYFWQRAPASPSADVIEEIVRRRLTQFSAVCTTYGCKVLLVLPPLLRDRGDGSLAALARAGRDAGVPVLTPVPPGELGRSFFLDGFHVNQRGAEIFTPRLLETLREIPDNGLAGVEAMPKPRCSRSDPAVQC